jgi:hypothetical protein
LYLEAQLNELHATRKTMRRIKNGPGRYRKPRFIYQMLKNGAVKQEENKSEPA